MFFPSHSQYERVKKSLPAELSSLQSSSADQPHSQPTQHQHQQHWSREQHPPPDVDPYRPGPSSSRWPSQPEQVQRFEQNTWQREQEQQPSKPVNNLNVDWDRLQSALKTANSTGTSLQDSSQDQHVGHVRGHAEHLPQDRLCRNPSPSPDPAQISHSRPLLHKESKDAADEDDLDDLTLDDLKSLFENFKQLDRENQTNLITYMKKLEKTNPSKVMELKSHIHRR